MERNTAIGRIGTPFATRPMPTPTRWLISARAISDSAAKRTVSMGRGRQTIPDKKNNGMWNA